MPCAAQTEIPACLMPQCPDRMIAARHGHADDIQAVCVNAQVRWIHPATATASSLSRVSVRRVYVGNVLVSTRMLV